jgi:hypothetical protein
MNEKAFPMASRCRDTPRMYKEVDLIEPSAYVWCQPNTIPIYEVIPKRKFWCELFLTGVANVTCVGLKPDGIQRHRTGLG